MLCKLESSEFARSFDQNPTLPSLYLRSIWLQCEIHLLFALYMYLHYSYCLQFAIRLLFVHNFYWHSNCLQFAQLLLAFLLPAIQIACKLQSTCFLRSTKICKLLAFYLHLQSSSAATYKRNAILVLASAPRTMPPKGEIWNLLDHKQINFLMLPTAYTSCLQ